VGYVDAVVAHRNAAYFLGEVVSAVVGERHSSLGWFRFTRGSSPDVWQFLQLVHSALLILIDNRLIKDASERLEVLFRHPGQVELSLLVYV
jgi:hypothetical protein